jgi:integrase
MKKRPNRTGTIDQRPSGRWRVRAIVDGRRRTLETFPDEITAKRALKAWLTARDEGFIEAPSSVTLRTFGESWLNRRELEGSSARAKVRSIRGERSVWRRHVAVSELAAMPLQDVRAADVERFVAWLRQRETVHAIRTRGGPVLRPTGKPLTRSMQRDALRLVRQALDEALRLELVERNVADAVTVRRGGRVADLEDDWLRADEIEQLLACERISVRNRTAYACAIGLALRLNDLKALRVADVHLDARVPGPHVRVWIAKSEKWHRVPIAQWLEPWLRAHLATLPAGVAHVFVDADGAPYAKHYDFAWAAKREFRDRGRGEARKRTEHVTPSALELAGVERRIRFHDLRGTCATHLALGSWGRPWTLHEVQQMLAHTDQRVTERYVRRAVDAIASAMRETRGGPTRGGALVPRRTNGGVTSRDDDDARSAVNRLVGGSSPPPGAAKAR